MGMWKSYAENETFWTVFINGNNKDALVHYHWVLSLEIIERTEIIIEYIWNEMKLWLSFCYSNYFKLMWTFSN